MKKGQKDKRTRTKKDKKGQEWTKKDMKGQERTKRTRKDKKGQERIETRTRTKNKRGLVHNVDMTHSRLVTGDHSSQPVSDRLMLLTVQEEP